MLRQIVQTKVSHYVIVKTVASYQLVLKCPSIEDFLKTIFCLEILSDQIQKCSDKHQFWLENL